MQEKSAARDPRPAGARPRALVFAPFSPYPTQTGAHVGCTMVLEMVRRLGYDPVFASSPSLTDAPWTAERISLLARDLQCLVELNTAGLVDPIWSGVQTLLKPAFNDLAWVTPGLALWFQELVAKYRPELVLINYAKWGRLADCTGLEHATRILQTHDLLSVNKVFQDALDPFFRGRPLDLNGVRPEVLEESFFDAIELGEIPGLREELSVLRRFDLNILVSEQEEARVHRVDPAVATHHMPMVFPPRPVRNTYAEPPLFLAHTNNFNFQGAAYFAQRVLPLILAQEPGFRLRIAGNLCKQVVPVPGLDMLGFVDDLDGLYAASRYSICPLLGGTGQQVKVMEAMSHGLAVVVVPRIAEATGIVDGVNGLVAGDPAAYAQACLRLWRDPALARELGARARQYMLERHSFDAAYERFAADVRRARAGAALETRS